MRGVAALAAAVLAALSVSACGGSGAAPGSATPVDAHDAAGAIVFVADAPSTGLGVDNTDLLAATASGSMRDLTSTPAAENRAAWSADGTHVIYVRETTRGQENGAVALVAGVYVWSPGHGAPQRVASCSDVCTQGDFAWSPDGRRIAFVSNTNVWMGDVAIEVMNADGSGAHTICGDKRCGYGLAGPMWSPDSRKLVFSNQGSLGTERFGGSPPSPIWIANADGSRLKKLTQPNCDGNNGRWGPCAVDTAPAWSPDGRLIAFSHRAGIPSGTTSIDVMRADGSHRHGVYRCRGETCNQTLPLAWAPDGTAIAFGPITAQASSLRITTLSGKTTVIPTCAGSPCLSPEKLTWSPNGRQLAFIAGSAPHTSVWVIGRNGTGLHRVAGALCCLAWLRDVSLKGAEAVPRLVPGGHLDLSGSIIYGTPLNALRHFHLLSLGPRGTRLAQIPRIHGKEPTLSPDGREIAFAGVRGGDFRWHIKVADRNGENFRVVMDISGTEPAWSPDGRTIAFTRESGGSRRWIGVVPAAGGSVGDLKFAGSAPSWNPSGSELVFQRRVASGEALFTVRRDGRGLRRLTNLPGDQDSPAWSPDGKEIAFEWGTPAGVGLYLIRPDGTHLRRVTPAPVLPARPAWSPDGQYLAVISDDGARTRWRVLVIDVKTGRVSTVATVPRQAADPSWSSH